MPKYLTPKSPITSIRYLDKRYLSKLRRLGLESLQDLLFYFPRDYKDFSNITPIEQLRPNKEYVIRAKVKNVISRRTSRKNLAITEALIEDPTGSISAIWFNQPFLEKTLSPGREAYFAGKVGFSSELTLVLSHPHIEVVRNNSFVPTHTARIIPIYPETEGVSSRYLRFLIKQALQVAKKIPESLPHDVMARNKLLSIRPALQNVHFPSSLDLARQARKRFIFEELFLVQVLFQQARAELKTTKAPAIRLDVKLLQRFVSSLPFKLTNAQRRATWQIIQDLAKPSPMNRLLEGDVGSGKTIIAIAASLATLKAGYQVAILAPTEVLARQHYKEFKERLEAFAAKVGLLLSSESRPKKRSVLIKDVHSGNINILIGTHALLEKKVRFSRLGLVIIDEQHRFGIRQRHRLLDHGSESEVKPHLLTMTATPIPRTLALGLYGDLDISRLDEKPRGRRSIVTAIIPPSKRQKAYEFIKKQLKQRHQAFIVCPIIDESSKLEVRSVLSEYEKLSKDIFPHHRLGLLHGRMRPQEKSKIMDDFKKGRLDILVATSVIEVGVDVPRATVMIVEGAERFGLAQLHQLRGRVGRSTHKAYCFLFTESAAKTAHARLKALVNTNDGLKLAEKDLKIRGPGDFIGVRQSGLPSLAMASLDDLGLIEKVKQEAARLVAEDSTISSWPRLKQRILRFRREVHLE